MKREVSPPPLSSFLLMTCLVVSPVSAARYDVWQVPEFSASFPGGYVALAADATSAPYEFIDQEFLWGPTPFSFTAIYDTGASGIILGQWTAFNLPVDFSGETYEDYGIGGVETFDVTGPTHVRLAPTSLITGEDYGPITSPSVYMDYGAFKIQVSRNMLFFLNIVGTPVLAHHVMQVCLDDWRDMELLMGVVYAKTDLLATMPTSFGGLPAFSFPLRMVDYVPDPHPISAGLNPLLTGVRVRDHRKPPDQQSAPEDWLFDTGAQITIISRDYATRIGIDLVNEEPVDSTAIGGIGGQIEVYGYYIDEIVLTSPNGDEVVFHDAIVFVPEADVLPANLPGIFGMNLLSGVLFGDELEDFWIEPNFADFYFDGPNQTLTLVPIPVTVRGTVVLEHFVGDNTSVELTIRLTSPDVGGAGSDLTRQVPLNADGTFTLDNMPPGNFNITIQTAGFLRASLTNRALTAGLNEVGTIRLDSGDANGDNQVDFADFAILQNGYGQSGKTRDQGDFNGDGRITFEDFAILQNNYGAGIIPDGATALSATGQVLTGASTGCGLPGLALLMLLAWAGGGPALREQEEPRERYEIRFTEQQRVALGRFHGGGL